MSGIKRKRKPYSEISQEKKDEMNARRNARRRELYSLKKQPNKVAIGQHTKLKQKEEVKAVVIHESAPQPVTPVRQRIQTTGILKQIQPPSALDAAVPIYEIGESSKTNPKATRSAGKLNTPETINSSHKYRSTTGSVQRAIPNQPYKLPNVKSCGLCKAKRFPYESDMFCCSKGEIQLYDINIPHKLRELYGGKTPESKNFLQYIRPYNSTFAFTSFGVTLDKKYAKRDKGVYTFRPQGQIYHYINSLYPAGDTPSYLQLYFYDTENEVQHRMHSKHRLQKDTITTLIEILDQNPYATFFRSLREITNLDEHEIRIRANPILDTGTMTAPTASQVAAIWRENEDRSNLKERDILVHKHDGHSQRIRYYFGCYDALQYPLLFPFGEPGWHQGIQKVPKKAIGAFSAGQKCVVANRCCTADDLLARESLVCEENAAKRNMVSAREFYAYRFQIRPSIDSIILQSGRLLQQFAVDMYVKIETSRLDYFRNRQDEADLYQGIVDSIGKGESRGSKVGKRIILPGSFIGGPRDMRKRYLDAMTLVERYGKPDIFLTMTCNPKRTEITAELQTHEEAQNRPDLLTRIFRSKLEHLKKEVIKKQLFGPVAAYTYVIEFQKRGLPHVHMLLILKKGYKLNTTDKFDAIISAELPDKISNPHLYSMVVKHMMHGPCGDLNMDNVCMKNKKCKNNFPKKYREETIIARDGYPIYKRRANNEQVMVRGQMLDNRWVVPYNPYLLAMFDCHINVEVCSTIKAVKYLYKYMYKGHDKIAFKIVTSQEEEDYDEIRQFQSARWISPPEAMWRIYRFNLYDTSPAVISLQLHLQDCQVVTFKKNSRLDDIQRKKFFSKTMLTEFFYMNQHDKTAKLNRYLYKDFPSAFVWTKLDRKWTKRKSGNVVGRIISANPIEGERYYLRILLNHVRCPTSFEYLKTIGGKKHTTFREAALAHGLLKDDKSNERCLEEACIYQMPISLRQLFCTVPVHCNVINPKELFFKFEDCLKEDFVKRSQMCNNQARQTLLLTLKSEIESMGKKLGDYGLDELIQPGIISNTICKEIEDEKNIHISEIDLQSVAKLNAEQLLAYKDILEAVTLQKPISFFIDGPGGTGKTFLYRALLATVRSRNLIALATATSGVAASILPNGRTAHSRFKIPLDSEHKLCCNVSKQTELASLLKSASLIIWDEASMAKRQTVEALDNLLRDLTEVDSLFGGKVIVLGGDFRQVLPVIPKGTRDECIDASLVRSPIWPLIKKHRLKENMRAKTDPAFCAFLLRVGDGIEPQKANGKIALPPSIVLPPCEYQTPLQQLMAFVFPNLHQYSTDAISMIKSAILCPRNDSVDQINEELINRFPGKEQQYLSIDEAANKLDQGLYVDFMHSLSPPGLPPHRLILKRNCPIILLRNINPSKGLCNGTRLICRNFEKNTIIAEIAVGERKGDIVFIPRIPLKPSDSKMYPINFTRQQFPVKLCFAMTINKAQGQTLDIVGLNLIQPVFAQFLNLIVRGLNIDWVEYG